MKHNITLLCECTHELCQATVWVPKAKVAEVIGSKTQYFVSPHCTANIFPEDRVIEQNKHYCVVQAPVLVISR